MVTILRGLYPHGVHHPMDVCNPCSLHDPLHVQDALSIALRTTTTLPSKGSLFYAYTHTLTTPRDACIWGVFGGVFGGAESRCLRRLKAPRASGGPMGPPSPCSLRALAATALRAAACGLPCCARPWLLRARALRRTLRVVLRTASFAPSTLSLNTRARARIGFRAPNTVITPSQRPYKAYIQIPIECTHSCASMRTCTRTCTVASRRLSVADTHTVRYTLCRGYMHTRAYAIPPIRRDMRIKCTLYLPYHPIRHSFCTVSISCNTNNTPF